MDSADLCQQTYHDDGTMHMLPRTSAEPGQRVGPESTGGAPEIITDADVVGIIGTPLADFQVILRLKVAQSVIL